MIVGMEAYGIMYGANDHFRITVYQSVTLTVAETLRLRISIIAWLLLQYIAPILTHVDPVIVAYRR